MENVVRSTGTGFPSADFPSQERVLDCLQLVADELGADVCWLYQGSYHFTLELDGWTLSVTPESAGRLRVETCHRVAARSTVWCLADDEARLVAIVREIACEAVR